MKKTILSLVLTAFSLMSFGQKGPSALTVKEDLAKGTKSVNTESFPLAEGLTYTLVKTKNLKNEDKASYFIKIKMNKPLTKTLNSELKASVEFCNGDFVSKRETEENSGWFNGTFTIGIYNLQRTQEYGIEHFIIEGDKTEIYCIDKEINTAFKNNFAALVNTQL
jgi:hypothetical protein